MEYKCEGLRSAACDYCSFGFSYSPKMPNGVLFIFKEPGGKTQDTSPLTNLKENGKWFKNEVCGEKGEKITKYRNRLLELLPIANREKSLAELSKCHYANICYAQNKTTTDGESGYGTLRARHKRKRFYVIRDSFLEEMQKNGIKKAYIFLIKDTFDTINNQDKKDGLQFGKYMYQMYSDKKEDVEYIVYAVHHPLGASLNVERLPH